jgi:hypothetical protein
MTIIRKISVHAMQVAIAFGFIVYLLLTRSHIPWY